jgi:hypothetical protein
MAFLDRTDTLKPKGVETYRTASGRVMVEPVRGSTLKRAEVRKVVQSVMQQRLDPLGKTSR